MRENQKNRATGKEKETKRKSETWKNRETGKKHKDTENDIIIFKISPPA